MGFGEGSGRGGPGAFLHVIRVFAALRLRLRLKRGRMPSLHGGEPEVSPCEVSIRADFRLIVGRCPIVATLID